MGTRNMLLVGFYSINDTNSLILISLLPDHHHAGKAAKPGANTILSPLDCPHTPPLPPSSDATFLHGATSNGDSRATMSSPFLFSASSSALVRNDRKSPEDIKGFQVLRTLTHKLLHYTMFPGLELLFRSRFRFSDPLTRRPLGFPPLSSDAACCPGSCKLDRSSSIGSAVSGLILPSGLRLSH